MGLQEGDYRGNVNVGHYGLVTEAFSVFAPGFTWTDGFAQPAELRLAGTPMVGLFAAGNSNGAIVPDIMTRHEEEQWTEAGIGFTQLGTTHTAMGNLVLCNDRGAVIAPSLADHRDIVADALDVPVATGTVAGLELPGSCGVATDDGVLLHRDATEDEIAAVEEALGVDADTGSVNFGIPYVHSGVLATTQQLLVGNETTGPELQRIQDALGFL